MNDCVWYGNQLIIPKDGRNAGVYKGCDNWQSAFVITEGSEFLIDDCDHVPVLLLVDTMTGNSRVEGFFDLKANDSSYSKIAGVRGLVERLYFEMEEPSDSCEVHYHIIHGLSELGKCPLKEVLFTEKSIPSKATQMLQDKQKLLETLHNSEERLVVRNTMIIHTEDSTGKLMKKEIGIILQLPVKFIDHIEYRNL